MANARPADPAAGTKETPPPLFLLSLPDVAPDWTPQTEAEIDRVVQAIVAQDPRYAGDGARLSTSKNTHRAPRYAVGGFTGSLQTLAGRVRQARGLHSDDTRALSESTIIADWRMRLFQLAAKPAPPPPLPLALPDVAPDWTPQTEAEIDRVVQAIVAQDPRYAGDGARLSTGRNTFSDSRYAVGRFTGSLHTLAGRVRSARGLLGNDWRALPHATIVAEWKARLFGMEGREMTPEGFAAWVAAQGLDDLVAALANTPEALEAMLEIVAPGLAPAQLAARMRAFAALQLGKGWQAPATAGGGGSSGPDAFIEALLRRRALLATLHADQLARIQRAMERHWSAAWNRDPTETCAAIAHLHATVDDPRVQQLLAGTLAHFRAAQHLTIGALRTTPAPFQRAGILFLAERDQVLLADEQGLGKTLQAIGAVELLRERGTLAAPGGRTTVLIVTPAAVKQGWARQLSTDPRGGHLRAERRVVVIQGSRAVRREAVLEAARTAEYVIVHPEYLVSARERPDEWAALTDGVALTIIDEAQTAQNPYEAGDAQAAARAVAIRAIRAPRTWRLSATPYYNRVEHLWSHLHDMEPGRHGTLAAFRRAHRDDDVGLITCHQALRPYMLRRIKAEVATTYDAARPLDDQPLGVPLVRWIAPADEGHYTMSPESQRAALLLLTDFPAFWDLYGDPAIHPDDVIPPARKALLFTITNAPDTLGLNGIAARDGVVDAIVQRRLAAGQKLVLYAERRREAERLAGRFAAAGSVLYWGGMTETAKEAARQAFQEGEARVIVGTEAMILGIDLTAADALIIVQRPRFATQLTQLVDRLVRLDPFHRKHVVDIVTLTGVYAEMPDATEAEAHYLALGSYDELSARELADSLRVFRIVMDLPYAESHLRRIIDAATTTRLFGDQTASVRKRLAAGEIFYPLYQAARGFDPAAQDRGEALIVQLAELYAGLPEAAAALCETLLAVTRRDQAVPQADLAWIVTLRQLRHKFLRRQVLALLPAVCAARYAAGRTWADDLGDPDDTTALPLLLDLLRRGEDGGAGAVNLQHLARAIAARPNAETETARLSAAALRLVPARDSLSAFLARHTELIEASDVAAIITLFQRLAELSTTAPALFTMIMDETATDLADLMATLHTFDLEPYFDGLALPRDAATTQRLTCLRQRGAPIQHLLELATRFAEAGDATSLARLREMAAQIVAGTMPAWRAGGAGRNVGPRAHDGDFWTRFQHGRTTHHAIGEPQQVISAALMDLRVECSEAVAVVSTPHATDEAATAQRTAAYTIEPRAVWQRLGALLAAPTPERRLALAGQARSALRLLEVLQTGQRQFESLTGDERTRIATAVGQPIDLDAPAARERALGLLRGFVAWAAALTSLEQALDNPSRRAVDRALADWAHVARRYPPELRKVVRLVGLAHEIMHALRLRATTTAVGVTIRDVDAWEWLIRVGQISESMVNCLVTSGDPQQTRALLDLLGSRNKRFLLVEDQAGEIAAWSLLKIRADADGTLVFHLERPFGPRAGLLLPALLAHVGAVRDAVDPRIRVTRFVRTPAERTHAILLSATGSAGEWEYVEDLFGVRAAHAVQHLGVPTDAPPHDPQ